MSQPLATSSLAFANSGLSIQENSRVQGMIVRSSSARRGKTLDSRIIKLGIGSKRGKFVSRADPIKKSKLVRCDHLLSHSFQPQRATTAAARLVIANAHLRCKKISPFCPTKLTKPRDALAALS